MGILQEGEAPPLELCNADGKADFVLICEHAGKQIPRSYGDMGLSAADLQRHIAWDIGARQLALALSQHLDAPLFAQRYSRLLCDCNRRPQAADFVPKRSEDTDIPANQKVSEEEKTARAEAVFWPFHRAVSEALDRRKAAGKRTLLVTVHSFTPVFLGKSRPWQIGVLYNRDAAFSPAMLHWLRRHTDYCVGDNEPYRAGDTTDYAIPIHGEARSLPCCELEIRNDLLQSPQNIQQWADLLGKALTEVARTLP